MEADFSGWATKSGLKCSDGRTIMPGAFAHQDTLQVPLVWQHSHTDPENVLGHAILENREEGVYCHAYFNANPKSQAAKESVHHKDIRHMSIWANELIERSKRVMHGSIREVSLVLSGANPGALIETIGLRHSEFGDVEELDEAIIFTGLELVHSDEGEPEISEEEEVVEESEESEEDAEDPEEGSEESEEDAEESDEPAVIEHADSNADGEMTIGDVYESMSKEQKDVLHYMVGEAIAEAESNNGGTAKTGDNVAHSADNNQEGEAMSKTNVFEGSDTGSDPTAKTVLSHSQVAEIVADASRNGSLKEAVNNYALAHGIDDIGVLFPDAQSVTDSPEFLSRRMEWVDIFLSNARKSPFSRVKSISADITEEAARAKGYIKGNVKAEEFFGVASRITVPTTIYKKQALDRDDILDITDFDVVTWLKAEMRIMLDEELARACLFGDGRDYNHTDKVNVGNIRPIASDHELYTTKVNVNIDDANSSIQEFTDAVIMNRSKWKGSGTPMLFTTELYIGKWMLLKDSLGRRIYKDLGEVASELRVAQIVPVEAMEEDPTIIGVLVNPADYVIGADKGAALAMFDDFDIDYNKYKYLIETRVSGALTKLKSAIAFLKVASTVTLLTPNAPTFNSESGVITIVAQTGVVYKNEAGTTLTPGAQTALANGASLIVQAFPSSASYAFNTTDDDEWMFTRDLA